jgi:hypothetical protein
MVRDFHPPRSFSSSVDVPACRCHDAQLRYYPAVNDDVPPGLPADPDEKMKAESARLVAELAILIERAKRIVNEHKQLIRETRAKKKLPEK